MKILSGYRAAILVTALVPLAFWFVVSCSSTPAKVELSEETVAEWNAAVDKTIQDPQRAAKLKDLGQQLIDVSEATEQDIEALNRRMMALNEDYNATQAEMQELIGDFQETRNARFAQYRDIIFAMRSEVSADEWKHLIK
jgi:DNA anti-recombination protein RmuC